MISSVVVVPAAPILLPEYAGQVEAVPGLFERCVTVVAGLADLRFAAIYASDREPRSSKPAIGRRVAQTLLLGDPLPLDPLGRVFPLGRRSPITEATEPLDPVERSSLETKARMPLRPTTWFEIPWDSPVSDCTGLGREIAAYDLDALLVMADGSASRSEKAPGHLHPDAAAVDDQIITALRKPDAAGLEALMSLDPAQCAEVLAAGRAPLQVMAAAMSATGPWQGRSVEILDPLGVLYIVAELVS